MFHSETTQKKKTSTIENLTGASELRIVVATSKLEIGVNGAFCHIVILYGPQKSLIDFMQETGRVGEYYCVVLLYYGQQLRNVDENVKTILNSTQSWRIELLKTFLSHQELKSVPNTGGYTCNTSILIN